jgi:hypothetical protein
VWQVKLVSLRTEGHQRSAQAVRVLNVAGVCQLARVLPSDTSRPAAKKKCASDDSMTVFTQAWRYKQNSRACADTGTAQHGFWHISGSVIWKFISLPVSPLASDTHTRCCVQYIIVVDLGTLQWVAGGSHYIQRDVATGMVPVGHCAAGFEVPHERHG